MRLDDSAEDAESRHSTRVNDTDVIDIHRSRTAGNMYISHRDGESGRKQTKFEGERERLLRAARAVLQRGGWWGFKVESVLRQSGLSTRSFYRHFDSKNDMLLTLMELEMGAMIAHITNAIETTPDPPAQIRAFVVAGMDMACDARFVKPSRLFALTWRSLMRDYPDAVNEWIARMTAPLQAAIQRGIDDGSVTSSDAAADAFAVFHLVFSITGDQAAQGISWQRDELERIVLVFVCRALRVDFGQMAEDSKENRGDGGAR